MYRTDWLAELNDDLAKRGVTKSIPFEDFVLVENDWATGRYPEDVADDIVAGKHRHVKPNIAQAHEH